MEIPKQSVPNIRSSPGCQRWRPEEARGLSYARRLVQSVQLHPHAGAHAEMVAVVFVEAAEAPLHRGCVDRSAVRQSLMAHAEVCRSPLALAEGLPTHWRVVYRCGQPARSHEFLLPPGHLSL